jgi:voltage-gated potassium channel
MNRLWQQCSLPIDSSTIRTLSVKFDSCEPRNLAFCFQRADRHLSDQGMSLRRRLSTLFDDDVPHSLPARIFNLCLALLIIVNVSAVILESVEPMRLHYPEAFLFIEKIATGIFALEYVLRVWTAVDLNNGRFRQPFLGRLHYMCGFFPIVDLIAVLPAVLGLIGAGDFRVLRLLRLLRMLKLTRHSSVFSLLWAVLREEAQAIAALVFVICLTLTVSGALMYMIEGSEQPTLFNSIPAGMWWAIETITTVGYGDMVPATLAGRVLGGIISVIGIGTLALFSGLITVGYLNQLRLRREHARYAKPHHEGYSDHHPPDGMAQGTLSAADGPGPLGVCPHCGGSLRQHIKEPEPAVNPSPPL